MSKQEKNSEVEAIKIELARRELARRGLLAFTEYTMEEFETTDFHRVYYTILDMFAHGLIKKLMVTMPPQHGKLCSDRTPVLTTEGWKKHGELEVGDYVFGRDGNPVQVLDTFNEGQLADYEVSFVDGCKIKVHGKHEWVVLKNRNKEICIETQELFTSEYVKGILGKRGSRCVYQVDANVCVPFEEKDLPIHPYLLGLWLGDGATNKPAITHHKDDIESIDKLKRLGYTPSAVYTHKTTGVLTSEFWGDTYQNFKKLDLAHKHGLMKHIPNLYKFSSREQRLELLAGMIDSDGYIYANNGRICISNINKTLIDDFRELCISLGFRCSIAKFDPKVSTSGIVGKHCVYQLTFNSDIYLPTALPRKQVQKINCSKRRRGIISIRKCTPEKGKCIQVEGGIYLVGTTLVPTHNSEGSSRKLPSYVMGIKPHTKAAILSYAASFAEGFNRDNQRMMDSAKYKALFPETRLPTLSDRGYIRNNTKFEIVGKRGSLKTVGRGGPLTGDPVDMAILDDLYKDSEEGNSPIIRQKVIDWYTSVVIKRLHNESQQLIVFTRWHEGDLIGWLEETSTVIEITNWDQLKNIDNRCWYKINFPALMNHKPTELDPREMGEALYPTKHSRENMEEQRDLDPEKFESMNQGDPTPKSGLLYGMGFKTYVIPPRAIKKRSNYTDTADKGDDFLCSIDYVVSLDNYVYVTDLVYNDAPQEDTEPEVATMLRRDRIRAATVESNNGGRAFGRALERLLKGHLVVEEFYQGDNKESRIITNAAECQRKILFPENWDRKYPEFYKSISRFKRKFSANDHDDAEDCLTGVLEHSGVSTRDTDALYRK